MIGEKEILKRNMEMAEHTNGTAQFLNSFLGGQLWTSKYIV